MTNLKDVLPYNPTISVIMGNYNHAPFITEALNKYLLLKQYFCEIIVADDCSTDNSWEILQIYAEKNPIIRLIKNPKNLGMIDNYIMLAQEAKGDYIIGAAADDTIIPENMEELLLAVKKYPEAMLFAGQNSFFDENKQRLIPARKYHSVSGYCPPGLFRYYKGPFLPIGPAGTLIRRPLFVDYYKKCRNMYTCADGVVSCMIIARYPFYYLKKPVAVIRVANDSRSQISSKQHQFQNQFYDVFFTFLKEEYPDLYEMLVECQGFRFFPPVRHYLLTHPLRWDKYTFSIFLSTFVPFFINLRYGVLPALTPNILLKYCRRIRNRIFGKPFDYPEKIDD